MTFQFQSVVIIEELCPFLSVVIVPLFNLGFCGSKLSRFGSCILEDFFVVVEDFFVVVEDFLEAEDFFILVLVVAEGFLVTEDFVICYLWLLSPRILAPLPAPILTAKLIGANPYRSVVFVGPFFRQKWQFLMRLHVFKTTLRKSV